MLYFARLIVVLFATVSIVACGSPASAPPQSVELQITEPAGPTERIELPLGAEVTMRITTEIDDHAHLHGYELEEYTTAGETIEWVFTANMAGTYELESHVTDSIWANVVVS